MSTFDESDGVILKNALVSALQEYHGTNNSRFEASSQSPTQQQGVRRGGGVRVDVGVQALEDALQLPRDTLKAFDEINEAFGADAKTFIENAGEIRRVYGEFIRGDIAGSSTAAQAAFQRLELMQQLYLNSTELEDQIENAIARNDQNAVKRLTRLRDAGADKFFNIFKSEAEAANLLESSVSKLTTQYGSYIDALDETTSAKIPVYMKSLGLSSQTIAKVMEKSILHHNEASTKMLERSVVFSRALTKEVNAPFHVINDQLIKIQTNTRKYGNITENQAIRIAANINSLGMKMSTFESTMDHFKDYDSAAKYSADIAQITMGRVQLDSQKLMELRFNDPAKFITEMREQFLAGGIDKAYLQELAKKDKARYMAILEFSQMDEDDFLNMLDRTRKTFSEAEISGMMKKQQAAGALEEGKAMDAVIDQLPVTEKAFMSHADRMAEIRRKNALAYKRQLLEIYETSAVFEKQLNATLQRLPDPFSEAVGPQAVEKIEKYYKDAGDALEDASKDYAKGKQKVEDEFKEMDASLLDNKSTTGNEIQKELERQAENKLILGAPTQTGTTINQAQPVSSNQIVPQSQAPTPMPSPIPTPPIPTTIDQINTNIQNQNTRIIENNNALVASLQSNLNILTEQNKLLMQILSRDTSVSLNMNTREVGHAIIEGVRGRDIMLKGTTFALEERDGSTP